jgi:hypothetical protein
MMPNGDVPNGDGLILASNKGFISKNYNQYLLAKMGPSPLGIFSTKLLYYGFQVIVGFKGAPHGAPKDMSSALLTVILVNELH